MDIAFFTASKSFKQEWPQVGPLLDRIIDSGVFSNGAMTRQLEAAVAEYVGARHAIAVGNGTTALIIALKAMGIGPGDEVIVPPVTFFASVSSVLHVGAVPVFADIEPESHALDPGQVLKCLSPRTKAVMPVHVFAQMANMSALRRIAAARGVLILEDSAQGIGMRVDGIHAGRWGQAGVLSFFPAKTLGGIGDGGMILTDDDVIARAASRLSGHGSDPGQPCAYHTAGLDEPMDEIQAAVLYARLQRLEALIARRAELAAFFDRRLARLEPAVRTPKVKARPYKTEPVYYVYLIEAEARDALVNHLTTSGIGTETYYPMPLHLQPCLAHLGYRDGDFPVAERLCRRALGLPFYPDLTLERAERVCQAIEAFYAGGTQR